MCRRWNCTTFQDAHGNCVCCWTLYIHGVSLRKSPSLFLLFYLKKKSHMQLHFHFSLVRTSMLGGVRAGELLYSCLTKTLRDPCSGNPPVLLSPRLMPAVLGSTFPAWNSCIRVWTEWWDQHSQPGLGEGWSGGGHQGCPSVGLCSTPNIAGGRITIAKPHRKEKWACEAVGAHLGKMCPGEIQLEAIRERQRTGMGENH